MTALLILIFGAGIVFFFYDMTCERLAELKERDPKSETAIKVYSDLSRQLFIVFLFLCIGAFLCAYKLLTSI